MALAPDASRCHEDKACDADAQEVVAGQQGDLGEGLWVVVVEEQRDRVCGEQGREGGGDNGPETEDAGDQISTP